MAQISPTRSGGFLPDKLSLVPRLMAVCNISVHGLSSTLREDKGGSVTVRGGRLPTQSSLLGVYELRGDPSKWFSSFASLTRVLRKLGFLRTHSQMWEGGSEPWDF